MRVQFSEPGNFMRFNPRLRVEGDRFQFSKPGNFRRNVVFGAEWDKQASPILTRTDDAIGLTANVGVDDQVVYNDFDSVPIFGDIHDVTDELGNVFVRIPKLYIRKKDAENYKSWQVSNTKLPGFYLPWCFWDFENQRELPYVDVGKYKASLCGG